ncbi:MAG: FAD-binding oxidoreductase [Myxococcaceae bacterium]
MREQARWSGRIPGFSGELVGPGDSTYEARRHVWNAMIDRRPAVIARCNSVEDVQAALAAALRGNLPIAVRGGAHNVAGNATVDGGMVIDLSPMRRIEVDPSARRATAGPGLTWGELDAATHAHGLATTGGLVSTTGIAGFTLGGGIGWLMRQHGLTVDNLVGADVVTAAGERIRADEENAPDLFWALRGGGGNIGIVTRFEYRLHPVSQVLGGLTLYPASRAGAMLRYFREVTESAPDALTLLFAFLTAPPAPFVPPALHGKPVVAILGCWAGDATEGERVLRPLRAFGPPAADVFGPMPYPMLQSMLDAGAPAGLQNYWKGGYVSALSDAAIDTVVEHASRMRSPLSQVHLHHLGGAVARVAPEATAFAHRHAAFALNVVATWPEPGPAAAVPHMDWARAVSDAMAPHCTGGVYVNFLGDEGEERVRAAYPPATYQRLREVKRRHDPHNVFRLNQNIRPD